MPSCLSHPISLSRVLDHSNSSSSPVNHYYHLWKPLSSILKLKHIFGVTNHLCEALQRKDQDILNTVDLIRSTKEKLQSYRLEGFDSLLKDVTSFCDKHETEVVNMEEEYVDPKYRRRKTNITNRHHYVVNNFNTVLDMQIQEFGNRFSEHLKTELHNRMGDGYLNDACICYIEREFLQEISVEDVMQRFQKMKPRREQL
ncbi:hypothetical protein E3N88_19410 [Mikania micrantha]|uniref:Uncharacterized protein n=1 Tax=Mikania micrantha TaxID=192012 RepID=A0A5N6NNK9_9ASTR|nr:hypothetical protein E3N88_19410 [Mikania micrantha]